MISVSVLMNQNVLVKTKGFELFANYGYSAERIEGGK